MSQADIYQDEDNSRKDDIASLKVDPGDFKVFYDRVKDLKDYYRNRPIEVTEVSIAKAGDYISSSPTCRGDTALIAVGSCGCSTESMDGTLFMSSCRMSPCLLLQAENDELALREEPKVDFSGEEGQGRFLDLHEHYHTFINSKFGHSKEQAPKEYQEYVSSVTDFAQIPRQNRISRPYRYTTGWYQCFYAQHM